MQNEFQGLRKNTKACIGNQTICVEYLHRLLPRRQLSSFHEPELVPRTVKLIHGPGWIDR